MEGWHGIRFSSPTAATRRDDRHRADGDEQASGWRTTAEVYHLPLRMAGPGDPLHAAAGSVPMYVAALGPRN